MAAAAVTPAGADSVNTELFFDRYHAQARKHATKRAHGRKGGPTTRSKQTGKAEPLKRTYEAQPRYEWTVQARHTKRHAHGTLQRKQAATTSESARAQRTKGAVNALSAAAVPCLPASAGAAALLRSGFGPLPGFWVRGGCPHESPARRGLFVRFVWRFGGLFGWLWSLVVEFGCLRWSRSDVTFSTDGPAQVP